MKVLIAVDSYKGSMTSLEAGNAAKKGVLQSCPDAEVLVKPLADGGEGTVDALVEGLQGNRIEIEVSDPLGRKTTCSYGVLPDGTAVMEMAQASGLTKLADHEYNPLVTTTYGVGEMIIDAIRRGCRKFVIGIGGSATNDGGVGMLSALGYTFLDENGNQISVGAQVLGQVVDIRDDHLIEHLQECEFKIACDVDNPLCGERGATYVYGPQKGLQIAMCPKIDRDMQHYSDVVEEFLGKRQGQEEKDTTNTLADKPYRDYPGAGAAGGMGFAFLAFLQGELVSGVELILDTIGLEQELPEVDVVITGEGRLDAQTAMGKAPMGVASRAKQYGCKVIAFAGCIGAGAEACKEKGIDEYYSIAEEAIPLKERMKKENAIANMQNAVANAFE